MENLKQRDHSPTRSAFRGDMLRLIREARGMSQTQICKISGISQSALSKLESGIQDPDSQQLSDLTRSLGVSSRFFYRTEPIVGVGPNELFHRKRKLGKKKLAAIHAQMHVLTLVVQDLLNSVELDEPKIPEWDRDDIPDIEKVAEQVRVFWHIPGGPITSVSALLQRVGVVLIPFDFAGEKIDAIGRWSPGLPPIIFFNPETPDDRLRFTLAHELGHFILHYARSLDLVERDLEREADMFASAFLLPAKEVAGSLRSLTMTKLGQLKLIWKSSMSSLIYRAKQVESISSRTADELFRQMSLYGYRTNEPPQYAVHCEFPDSQFKQLVDLHLDDLGYTLSELSSRTGLSDQDMAGFLRIDQPSPRGLRLVY